MGLVKWFKRHLPETFLFLILSFLCFQNFTPGTYLTGWDNLMPELNIGLNLKRSFFAVWQEYQGLGLVGGMAHATDLIRQLILFPFTFILPQNLIRYSWHFAMIFLGTFGIFFGLKKTLKFSPWISFCCALFYLLNFGSIQYFWNPLETFSTFWGFFPWLIFSLWDYLKQPSTFKLYKLLTFNLLAIPGFYVQTLFIVYMICVSLILIFSKIHFKKIIQIFLLIFAINSFWLLPQIYFLSGNLNNPTQGIGNFMSNDDTFARNLASGNIADFLLLRGYYYDFPDLSGKLMAPWITHLSNQFFLFSGYLLSFFVIVGLIYLIIKPKLLPRISIILFFLLSTIALLSAVFPFDQINSLLRQFPLVNQIFRSPWTKFLVPAAFTFSILSAYGLHAISRFLSTIKYPQNILFVLHTSYVIILILFSSQAFMGNYISPKMRIKIPTEYFQLQTYFNTQNHSGRIMNLPQGSFWGWTNYRWGYTGSGFLWYLLPQPILDRAFDAWNLENENYYWQLSTAIQERNPDMFGQILSKYNIQYIIFDNNIYFPDDKVFAKNTQPTQQLLPQINGLKFVKKFENISVYEYKQPTAPYVTHSLTQIKPVSFFNHDPAFGLLGDYTNSSSSKYDFPYQSLFTNRLSSENKFSITESNGVFQLTIDDSQTTFPINNSANLTINTSNPFSSSEFHELNNTNNSQLFVFNFPSAFLSQSYLVKIEHQNISGLPLEISVVSENIQNKYLNTNLSNQKQWQTTWLIIPARQKENFDSGISVIFNNKSLNHLPTINQIKSVKLYPFPYFSLITTNNLPSLTPSPRQYVNSTNHLFWYKVTLNNNDYSTLILPQSFSPGWLAISNGKILPHFLVNNWSNGWQIDNQSSTIFLLFWPQLLQFFGSGLLLGTIIYSTRQK